MCGSTFGARMYDKSAEFIVHPGNESEEIRLLRNERDDARRELSSVIERENRVMDALNITNPERLEHDLRNILNELGLLRALFNESAKDGTIDLSRPDR